MATGALEESVTLLPTVVGTPIVPVISVPLLASKAAGLDPESTKLSVWPDAGAKTTPPNMVPATTPPTSVTLPLILPLLKRFVVLQPGMLPQWRKPFVCRMTEEPEGNWTISPEFGGDVTEIQGNPLGTELPVVAISDELPKISIGVVILMLLSLLSVKLLPTVTLESEEMVTAPPLRLSVVEPGGSANVNG